MEVLGEVKAMNKVQCKVVGSVSVNLSDCLHH
jgi:hypothetical protein